MAVQAEELPVLPLEDSSGFLKVVIGEYSGQASKIPTYAKQNLYHIHLKAGQKFIFSDEQGLEYAVFLLKENLIINDTEYYRGNYTGDFIGFDEKEGIIEIINNSQSEAEFILFGGEPYTESFVAQGPFVMNTQEEIDEAYSDSRKGKYGKVIYN